MWTQLLVLDMSSMHTESSYCQSHEVSPHSSSVFVAVLFLSGSLAYLFTDMFDQLRGSYNHRRLLFPSRQRYKTQ